MVFPKKYSCLCNEFINTKNSICRNRERAYNYYADLFKKDYPKKSVKGEERYLYTNTTYELDQAQYMSSFSLTQINIKLLCGLWQIGCTENYTMVNNTEAR